MLDRGCPSVDALLCFYAIVGTCGWDSHCRITEYLCYLKAEMRRATAYIHTLVSTRSWFSWPQAPTSPPTPGRTAPYALVPIFAIIRRIIRRIILAELSLVVGKDVVDPASVLLHIFYCSRKRFITFRLLQMTTDAKICAAITHGKWTRLRSFHVFEGLRSVWCLVGLNCAVAKHYFQDDDWNDQAKVTVWVPRKGGLKMVRCFGDPLLSSGFNVDVKPAFLGPQSSIMAVVVNEAGRLGLVDALSSEFPCRSPACGSVLHTASGRESGRCQ